MPRFDFLPSVSESPPAANRAGASASPSTTYRILVLGGGEAGLTALKMLSDPDLAPHIALMEPSTYHYDQSSWVDVGMEGLEKEETRSQIPTEIPSDVQWIQERATNIDPASQIVTTESGTTVGYDYLLVALGTRPHWDRIRDLASHLGSHGICSVYGYEQAERTWEMIREFEGGRALFTAPSTPFKGGSTPLRLLRMAEDVWHETGVHDDTDLYFTTAARPELAGERYAELIEREETKQDIHVYTGYELIDVRPERKEALFSVRKGNARSEGVLPYDLLHVVPPMRPPEVLENSELSYQDGPMKGYMDIRPDSFRHKRFDTVFGVGDAIGIEGVKTGERARKQAEAVAQILHRCTHDAE